MKPISVDRTLRTVGLYAGLAILLLFLAFPIYYMFITSFKAPGEAYRLPPTLFPLNPTLDAYPYVLQQWSYWRTLLNTVLVAGGSALFATIIGGISAFGFSRMEFRGKSLLYALLIGTIAIPAMVTLGPIFITYKNLNMLDTHVGLILVFVAEGMPLAFLTLFSYFKAIPRQLDEAAYIDGAGFVGTFFRIILPLAIPGFSVTFLLLFIGFWNEFLFAFTLTVTPEVRLLTVRLFEVPARENVNAVPYDLIAAGGVLILLPLVPLLIKVRDQLVEGILAGSLKD
jgi:ABC-type glycerol-3-phosphate transport system permease component